MSKRSQDPTTVTASLVPFHVASNTEGFSTSGARAFEWLFARMRMAVDAETGRPGERLVARLADVPIL